MVNSFHHHFYVAESLKRRGPAESLEVFAAWCGAETRTSRPLPRERPGLVRTAQGLVLRLPGGEPQRWHPNLTRRRLRDPAADPLVRVLDLRPDEVVLDGTLGFGYDALVMAAAGARVVALEVLGTLAVFTLDGLGRYAPDLARRIAVRRAEHAAWLAAAPDGTVDHVYLDPPFPADRPGTTPTFAPLSAVAPCQRPDAGLIAEARRVARRRVAVKLAPGEAPPETTPPARLLYSRRLRYAVWPAVANEAVFPYDGRE
jgi:hypothetical protein